MPHVAKNPERIDVDTIDVIYTHPIYGDIPFTAKRDDVELHGREIFAQAEKGNFGVVKAKKVK